MKKILCMFLCVMMFCTQNVLAFSEGENLADESPKEIVENLEDYKEDNSVDSEIVVESENNQEDIENDGIDQEIVIEDQLTENEVSETPKTDIGLEQSEVLENGKPEIIKVEKSEAKTSVVPTITTYAENLNSFKLANVNEWIVDRIYDNSNAYTSIFYNKIYKDLSNNLNIELYFTSEYAYVKDRYISVEFWAETNGTLTYDFEYTWDYYGWKSGYLYADFAADRYQNQEYIYMKIGSMEYQDAPVWSCEPLLVKVTNPYYVNPIYEGHINSELINFNLGSNNIGDYLWGEVVVVEWVNGISTVPKTTPTFTLKSTDGTVIKDLYMTPTGTNTYYFDGFINGLDMSKQYKVEVKSTNPNNTSIHKQMYVRTDTSPNIGDSGYLGTTKNEQDNKKVNFATDSGELLVKFDSEVYSGDINSELITFNLGSNNIGDYLWGEVVVVEWVNGVSTVPTKTPTFKLISMDGTVVKDLFMTATGTNTYYFDGFINGLDTSKQYRVQVESSDNKNISVNKKMFVRTDTSPKVGEYGFLGNMAKENKSVHFNTYKGELKVGFETRLGANKYTYNQTFQFGNFKYTFKDEGIILTKYTNSWYDYYGMDLILMPILVENLANHVAITNKGDFKYYAPNGNRLDNINYFRDEKLPELASATQIMQPGEIGTYYITMLYSGDGDYIVEFNNSLSEKITVTLPYTKQ